MSALCFCFLFRQCGQCQGRRSDQARISASETQVVASSKYFVKILYREPFSVTVSQQLTTASRAPCPVVSQENITEFQTKDGCSHGRCCHNQGDSKRGRCSSTWSPSIMLSAGPGAQRAREGGGASKCWLRMTISIPISGQLLVMSSTKSSSFQALHGKVICQDTGKTYWVRVMNYMFSGWRRASPWGRPTPRPGRRPHPRSRPRGSAVCQTPAHDTQPSRQ